MSIAVVVNERVGVEYVDLPDDMAQCYRCLVILKKRLNKNHYLIQGGLCVSCIVYLRKNEGALKHFRSIIPMHLLKNKNPVKCTSCLKHHAIYKKEMCLSCYERYIASTKPICKLCLKHRVLFYGGMCKRCYHSSSKPAKEICPSCSKTRVIYHNGMCNKCYHASVNERRLSSHVQDQWNTLS